MSSVGWSEMLAMATWVLLWAGQMYFKVSSVPHALSIDPATAIVLIKAVGASGMTAFKAVTTNKKIQIMKQKLQTLQNIVVLSWEALNSNDVYLSNPPCGSERFLAVIKSAVKFMVINHIGASRMRAKLMQRMIFSPDAIIADFNELISTLNTERLTFLQEMYLRPECETAMPHAELIRKMKEDFADFGRFITKEKYDHVMHEINHKIA